jgi:hypothetical protein
MSISSCNGSISRPGIFALLALLTSCAALALASAAPLPQSSQPAKKDYALIYGTVWGPDDHPVSGVPVTIRRASDKKARWELVSDRNGEFAQRVPVGTQDYIVQADIKTPKGQAKPEVTAHIDNNERTDISLHLTKQALSNH